MLFLSTQMHIQVLGYEHLKSTNSSCFNKNGSRINENGCQHMVNHDVPWFLIHFVAAVIRSPRFYQGVIHPMGIDALPQYG